MSQVQISIGNAEVTLGDTTLSVKGLELSTNSEATATMGAILSALAPTAALGSPQLTAPAKGLPSARKGAKGA